jgi:hypothetical protein
MKDIIKKIKEKHNDLFEFTAKAEFIDIIKNHIDFVFYLGKSENEESASELHAIRNSAERKAAKEFATKCPECDNWVLNEDMCNVEDEWYIQEVEDIAICKDCKAKWDGYDKQYYYEQVVGCIKCHEAREG